MPNLIQGAAPLVFAAIFRDKVRIQFCRLCRQRHGGGNRN